MARTPRFGDPEIGRTINKYKRGTLDRPGKRGSRVPIDSRDQAIAVALAEAGVSRDQKVRHLPIRRRRQAGAI